MSKIGKLFVISGPSGVGKSTVLDYLLEEKEIDVIYSISATTRAPRSEEEDGKDYFFLNEKEFLKKKENGEFLETAVVHNNYYGTPKKNVQKNLQKGNNIIFQSHIDGSKHEFSPEKSMEIQRILGSDIIMAFDHCTSYPCELDEAREAMERTHN